MIGKLSPLFRLLVAKGYVEDIFGDAPSNRDLHQRVKALAARSTTQTDRTEDGGTAIPNEVRQVYDRMLARVRNRSDVMCALAWLMQLGGSADADVLC
jgi:hypothetical protein